MYNEEGVKALKGVCDIVKSFGLPLVEFRKFNGILNAIEMQIEDSNYRLEVVEYLGRALIELTVSYKLDSQRGKLERAFKKFQKKLGKIPTPPDTQ